MRPIEFTAEVRQIKTLVDRSINIVLNIPEYHKEQAKALMDLIGDMVAVAMVKVSEDKQKEYGGRLK